jgi:ribosomal protein L14E/L6E/L27E
LTNNVLQVRKSIRTSTPRPTLQPGAILILLAGRFRGKRVILLKNLSQGVLLVTGPFKINGVPLRRVNARYVIATSEKVDLSGIDSKKVEEIADDKYFAREKGEKKSGEEKFFKQGEKAEVRYKSEIFWIITDNSIEEEAFKQPRRRPKGRRQGIAINDQEDPSSRQLSRQHIQLEKG